MSKVQKVVETGNIAVYEFVSLAEAFRRDPNYTINWLLHQPIIWAIISFLCTFLFTQWWGLYRGHSRESAKAAMLNIIADWTQKQTAVMQSMVSSTDRDNRELMIEVSKLAHKLDKIDDKLNYYDKRMVKVEAYIESSR